MKAIILTAGLGNRMRPLTDKVHKALLPILDHTILGRIIDGLAKNNVNEVAIVTGYKAGEIRSFMKSHESRMSVQYVHNERYRETNNIFSLALAFEQVAIDQDILIIECDLIFNASVIRQAIESPHANLAMVDHFRSGMDGTVVSVDGDVITQVIPPHLQSETFDYSDKYKTLNIYKFSEHFCNAVFRGLLTYYAKALDENCYYELILGILIYMQREEVHAEMVQNEDWAEVDDPNDLDMASFMFDKERRVDLLDGSNGGFWNHDILDFHFIRNMHFPTGAMVSALRSNLAALLHNYGSNQRELNRKLSYTLLYQSERLQVLNGASQVYPVLRDLYGDRKMLAPEPTFGEYPRNFKNLTSYSDAVGIDLAEMESKVRDVDVVVFVNPNNPTGTTLPSDAIYEMAERHPRKMFFVDESFIEFSDYASVIERLEREPLENILVIKSLSKTLGVPGLRLGYVYSCDTALVQTIGDYLPIWNLNSMAEFFLEALLKFRPELAESYAKTKADRKRFVELLEAAPSVETVYDSGANFVLVKIHNAGGEGGGQIAREMLARHSIYIKDLSSRFEGGGCYLRFAVRTHKDNRVLIDKLEETLKTIG